MPPERSTPSLLALGSTLGFGAFLALLSTTVVSVGIDRLRSEMSASLAQIQWVNTAYLLALAVAIPVAGWGIDRFGGRTLWLSALIVYLAGSALATAAESVQLLIASRVVQGFGAGMLEPIMLAMLTVAAGPRRVTRVLSLIQIPITLAPAFGPFVGGVIVDRLSWHWLFGLNLPLGLLALGLSLKVVPRSAPAATTMVRLDVPGFLLLSPALAALLYGLARTGDGLDLGSPGALLPVLVGAALLISYTTHALRRGEGALIDLRLFAMGRFAVAAAIACLFGASVYGMMFLLPLALQADGSGAGMAGLQLAPQGVGTILVLPFVAALSSRLGARTTVAWGMLLAAAGTVPYALPALHPSPVLLACALLLRGIGLGAVLGPALAAAYTSISPQAATRASSALVAMIQLGGAAGTALLAVVLQRQPPGTAAFGTTFWWVLGICAVGVLLAPALPTHKTDREVEHV